MDPITHGMFGVLLGGLGFKRKKSFSVLVTASMLPDMDILTRVFGPDVLLTYHRGVTHSIFALALLPALVAYVVTWQQRGRDFMYFFFLSLMAVSLHIYMDLTTKYGVQLISPLDDTFYSLYQVFIIDPLIVGSLVMFVVLSRKRRQWTRHLAWGVAAFILVYYGARVYLHESAEKYLARSLERHAIRNVSPLPGGVLRWWFVASGEDGAIKTGVVDMFMKRVYVHSTYPPQPYTASMEASKAADAVSALLRFSRFPYASQIDDPNGATLVRWEDLTFSYLPGVHFVAEALIGPDGEILRERLEL